jgi:hypothetical protein
LALLLAGAACIAQFVHVSGKDNPADLPSRAPFKADADGKHTLDLEFVKEHWT